MHVSMTNMVCSFNEMIHIISVLVYLTLLFFRLIPVICFKWDALGSLNFLIHVAHWFHRWLFNIINVQYGFTMKRSFLLRLAWSYGIFICFTKWMTKLVGWNFVFPCWSDLPCCCYCYILLKRWANGCYVRIYDRKLPSPTSDCLCFCRLFVNASKTKTP